MTRTHHRDGAAGLAIKTHPEPGGVRVCPRGEIDLATVDCIRRHIDQCVADGCKRVVLDLRDVTFMDSTGLHLILETAAAARAAEWELRLIEGPVRVERVFQLSGIRDALPFVETPPAPSRHSGAAARRTGARPI
jgi:anti-sigma B factor antagonist